MCQSCRDVRILVIMGHEEDITHFYIKAAKRLKCTKIVSVDCHELRHMYNFALMTGCISVVCNYKWVGIGQVICTIILNYPMWLTQASSDLHPLESCANYTVEIILLHHISFDRVFCFVFCVKHVRSMPGFAFLHLCFTFAIGLSLVSPQTVPA